MINGHNQLSFVFLSRTKYQTGFNRVAFCRSFGRSAEPRVQRLLGLRGSWWACEASAQLSVEGPSVWPAAPVRSTGHNRLNSPQAVHLYFAIYDRVQRVCHFFPPPSPSLTVKLTANMLLDDVPPPPIYAQCLTILQVLVAYEQCLRLTAVSTMVATAALIMQQLILTLVGLNNIFLRLEANIWWVTQTNKRFFLN